MDERISTAAPWDELNIVRIDGTRRYKRTDRSVKEEAYTLYINGQRVHTFACTPIHLEELAVGYAFAEGCFDDKGEIQDISVDREAQEIKLALQRKDTAQVPEGEGAFSSFPIFPFFPKESFPKESFSKESFSKRSFSEESFSKEEIYTMWDTFNEKCNLFHITGGVHAMALTDGKELLVLYEDVARHNAAAKTIGGMILRDLSPVGKAFIFSGRLALKICMMVERTGVKLLLCHGAATSSTVRRAEAAGITLAGFLRRGYMNIYTQSERITD